MKQCMSCGKLVQHLGVDSNGLYVCAECNLEDEQNQLREWYWNQVF